MMTSLTDVVRHLIRFSDGQKHEVEKCKLVLPITNFDVIGDVIDDVMWSRNRLYILLYLPPLHRLCAKCLRFVMNMLLSSVLIC